MFEVMARFLRQAWFLLNGGLANFVDGVLTLNPVALGILAGVVIALCCLYWFIVRRLSLRQRLGVATVLVLIIVAYVVTTAYSKRYVPAPLSLNVDSAQLTRTQIVPTLDTPIEPGKNVIWCASFLGAWKELETLANGPVHVTGADDICARLDAAADPRPVIPPECYYATAGWVQKGIIDTVHREVARRFPGVPQPEFPGILPDGFLTYACLKTQLKFTLPYFDSTEPLAFTDGSGNTSNIKSFGVRKEDESSYYALRGQVFVLFDNGERSNRTRAAFAVDLCRDSQPHQIVLAGIELGKSLAETLKKIEEKVLSKSIEDHGYIDSLAPTGQLLVPNVAFNIVHHFAPLENTIEDDVLAPTSRIDVALQQIEFCLDHGGAELLSQAKSYPAGPMPIHFIFDRPFLLYMKKRDAQEPYLVMWIENDELLQKWAE